MPETTIADAIAYWGEEEEDKTFTHVDVGYKPSVHLVNDDNGRRYEDKDGNRFKSVTQILHDLSSEGINRWRQHEINIRNGDVDAGMKHCDKWSADSMAVGTAMHQIIERYLKNEPAPKSGERAEDDKTLAFDPHQLFKTIKPVLNKIDNIRGVEIPVHSNDLGVCGTIDCVAEYEGKLAIIDHKNSRRKRSPADVRKYVVQEAIYAHMWEELTGERPELLVTNMATWVMVPRAYIYKFTPYMEGGCIAKFKEQQLGYSVYAEYLNDAKVL